MSREANHIDESVPVRGEQPGKVDVSDLDDLQVTLCLSGVPSLLRVLSEVLLPHGSPGGHWPRCQDAHVLLHRAVFHQPQQTSLERHNVNKTSL